MNDPINILMRVRENVRREKARLEKKVSGSGVHYASTNYGGRIDALKWVDMNITLELDHYLGEKDIKENQNE